MSQEASTTSTSFTSILTYTPLTPGNYLTVTDLELEGRAVGGVGLFRYQVNYADGTSFTSVTYQTSSVVYISVAEWVFTTECGYRGNITSITVQAAAGSSGVQAFARLTVSGYETGSTSLAIAKPIPGRGIEGSTNSTAFTPIATYTPLTSGQYLTPSELVLDGRVSRSAGNASFRYRITYADGTSFTSTVFTTNSLTDFELVNPKIPQHCNFSGGIASIVFEASTDSGSTTAFGRLTVSGFEAAP
jgi:hypothetical protein